MDDELKYNSPLVYQRADPWCYKHTDGFYYFTGSIPQYDGIELRRSKTLNGLLTANSRMIWKRHFEGQMSGYIWAPEIHYIDGAWWIYFTASDREDIWEIRPYALKCVDDDPIMGEWTEMGRIDIGHESFSLDMTSFIHRGKQYVCWAQTIDKTIGSCIYMASMKDPMHLDSKPMLLTKPDYDWEKQGFDVNEGPAVLQRNGKIIITYSASDTGHRYCMGMVWADGDTDLLDKSSWHKSDKPVFSSSEENSQYGPGHNSFTTDGDRDVLIYHSRNYKEVSGDPLHDPNRHARAKAFTYDENGLPVFGEPSADNF